MDGSRGQSHQRAGRTAENLVAAKVGCLSEGVSQLGASIKDLGIFAFPQSSDTGRPWDFEKVNDHNRMLPDESQLLIEAFLGSRDLEVCLTPLLGGFESGQLPATPNRP